MTVLYLDRPGMRIEPGSHCIMLRAEGERPQSVPLRTLERVIVRGAALLDARALATLGDAGIEARRMGRAKRNPSTLSAEARCAMTDYRRCRIPGGTYFFTVAVADRRSALLTEHVDALRMAFRDVLVRHPARIPAMVVLPEHLHCIWELPDGDSDFSSRWRQIKAAFSRGLHATEFVSVSRQRKGERGIWQRRFWEHAIRDDAGFARRFDYIHCNPVKHGLVCAAKDWPWSSFHRHVRLGVYPEDWGGQEVAGLDFEAG